MRDIKFFKEPGYTYDLFFWFILYFNKDYCLANFTNYNKSAEDTEYFAKIFDSIQPISDELHLFFWLSDRNKKSFMTQYYYEPYKEDFLMGEYNLAKVQTALSDYEQVVDNLARFYFYDAEDEVLEECKNSITVINRLIRKSKYNDSIKSALYSFFIEPRPVIQKLSYELMAKEFSLSQQYEKNYKLILHLQNNFEYEILTDKLLQLHNQPMDIKEFENVYISFCLQNKNCVKAHYCQNSVVLLLGADYEDYIEYLIDQERKPELDVFGNAISESNRIDILNLIFQREEITIKDIEQELGFTGTNAYYHLSLMIKAGMLKTRNKGRTVLYSINKQYFRVLSNIIMRYSLNYQGGKENERMEETGSD